MRNLAYNDAGETMKRILMLALLMLTATVARATNPVTIETDYDWHISQKLCTGATTCVFDVAGLGAGVSMSTMNVVGFKFFVLPIGSTATFTVAQIARVYGSTLTAPGSFNDSGHPTTWYGSSVLMSTSSAIVVFPGISQKDAYTGTFEAKTMNPYFSLSGLTVSGTTYLTVEYGSKHNVN
jgi:hypothetical protein